MEHNGSSSSRAAATSTADEYGDTYDEHLAVHRAELKLEAPPPGLTEMEGQLQRWRSTRYRRCYTCPVWHTVGPLVAYRRRVQGVNNCTLVWKL